MPSLWMLFSSFMFSIMGVCVKLASDWYSTAEIVMARGVVGVVVMYAFVRLYGGTLGTSMPWQHLWRGVIGVASLWLWFFAIGRLPLATGMTLNYMAPVWIAAILFVAGWWQGGARFEWGLTVAILVSFVGVTLLLRPAFHAAQWFPALAGLASGVLSALAYLQVRKLGLLGEPEHRVVFYFSLAGLVAGLLGALGDLRLAPPAEPQAEGGLAGLMLLLTIGATATIAQVAMTRAYRLGTTLVTANLQYSGIVFGSLWGVLIWGDILDWQNWAGILLILASGMGAIYFNYRRTLAAARRAASSQDG